MINPELIKTSLSSIRKRKARSALTIISVLIGVTAIFVLISFGQGLVSYVDDFSQKMGDDKLLVQPKGFGLGIPIETNVVFTNRDVNTIEDTFGVDEVTGMYYEIAAVEFEDEEKYVFVMGSDVKDHRELFNEIYNIEIYSGDDLTGKEKKDAVFGYNYLIEEDGAYPEPLELRDNVLINGIPIKVKGFYEAIGNPVDDYNVYLTKDGFENLFNPKSYQAILIRSTEGQNPILIAEKIKEELRKSRGQSRGNEDFDVQTFEQVIESFTSILVTINVVLVLIALISLIVAGVNIANTMYASVLERTKDIGVMKAIGAKNSNILLMFALESGILSLIGGVLAVGLGTIIALYAGVVVESAGYGFLQPALLPSLYIACLVFSLFIGIVSGMFPAYRASKMKPVDALRYE
ncbi:ABC transporter permease [Candidatus Woesearchaeota archaeon]|jgi:putative ABC transport system permease protein|nr:ABC transporter permease [Candidatus Woesearchaeota archaeon]MBT6044816.1 ABC transporter permease [Candidatus Woesearchaeota archaeon]